MHRRTVFLMLAGPALLLADQKKDDEIYDKVLYDRLRRSNAEDVRGHLEADAQFQQKSVRFIENHDEPRAIEAFGRERAMAAACGARAAQRSAVRRSCQTIARPSGCPVARSHTTTVSRWLVIPMPAMSFAVTPAFAIAERTVATTLDQMSSGSCSTWPGAG